MTVAATPAKEGAGEVSKTTRKKPVPEHVGDYPWLRCFAPGHPMAQTEAPDDAQVVLVFLKTRGLFEARSQHAHISEECTRGFEAAASNSDLQGSR